MVLRTMLMKRKRIEVQVHLVTVELIICLSVCVQGNLQRLDGDHVRSGGFTSCELKRLSLNLYFPLALLSSDEIKTKKVNETR